MNKGVDYTSTEEKDTKREQTTRRIGLKKL